MSKRRVIVRRRSRWTAHEWEEGWDLAMTLIEAVPPHLRKQSVFQDSLAVMNGAFADGNRFRFERGVGALMDFFHEAVEKDDA